MKEIISEAAWRYSRSIDEALAPHVDHAGVTWFSWPGPPALFV